MENQISLKQRKLLEGSRHFAINENGEVTAKYKTLFTNKEYSVSLFELDPKFERTKYSDVKFLVIAGLLLISAIWVIIDSLIIGAHQAALFALLFFAPAFICYIAFQKNSFDVIAVSFHQSRQNALAIWNNKPDKQSFDVFINTLKEKIEKTHLNPNLSDSEKIEIYAKHIGFLCDEGILSEDEADKLIQRTIKRVETERKKMGSVVSLVK